MIHPSYNEEGTCSHRRHLAVGGNATSYSAMCLPVLKRKTFSNSFMFTLIPSGLILGIKKDDPYVILDTIGLLLSQYVHSSTTHALL